MSSPCRWCAARPEVTSAAAGIHPDAMKTLEPAPAARDDGSVTECVAVEQADWLPGDLLMQHVGVLVVVECDGRVAQLRILRADLRNGVTYVHRRSPF